MSLVTVTFELGRDFCTVYLTAKFDRPTFSRSEVIMRTNTQHTMTNKHTPLKTSTSLRYTTSVDNQDSGYQRLRTRANDQDSSRESNRHIRTACTDLRRDAVRLAHEVGWLGFNGTFNTE